MASNDTEEQLKNLDKETIIRLFLAQKEQLENLDHTLQLVLEQLADLKRHRFGRSTERHETDGQIQFMEIDGNIVFFNEAEAVAVNTEEEQDGEADNIPRPKTRKKKGKREEDLQGLPVVTVEHSMDEKELEEYLGKMDGKNSRMRFTAGIPLPRQKWK